MKAKRITKLILACLFIVFGITAIAQPDWTVNPNQYVYSMTITGQITTDGYLSSDENDMLAAFIDGECRGVVNVKYVAAVDAYFVFLLVYSNDPIGTVNFKIYDASKNEEFEVKETINFTVNDIIGSVGNPFLLAANALNNEAKLLTFTIPNQVGNTRITGNDVYLQEHWSGDLLGIAPNFTLSTGAKAFVNGVEQISGVTKNDYLNPVEYTVEAADLSYTTVYNVHISATNDVPKDILLEYYDPKEENENVLTRIGVLTVETDDPDEEHIFSLPGISNSDNQYFFLTGPVLRTRYLFNYEEQSVFRVLVRADDQKGGVIEKYFEVKIVDVNDSPSDIGLINVNIPVNTPSNSVLGNLVAIDEDAGDSHVYTLAAGDGTNDMDNAKFYIQGNQLKNSTPLVFLTDSEYKLLVKAKDNAGASITVPLILSTKNQGNPPHGIVLSNTIVFGVESPPLFVGELAALDVDQKEGHVFTFSVNNEFGPDNDLFNIVNNALYLSSPEPVTQKRNYKILIAVTDSMGNQFTRSFTIEVKDKLGDGDFFLTNNLLPENKPFNTIVGYFDSQTLSSNVYSYSLPLEVDLNTFSNDKFKLSGRTLITNQVFDYEQSNTHMIQVEVSDGTTKITQDILVEINDENDPPTSISLSTQILSESAQLNSMVATLSTVDQDEGDSHVFSLVVGNGINDQGNTMFKISDNKLVLAKDLNYEMQEYHNILLRVTDDQGATFEQGLRLKVADANDAPEFLSTPLNYVLQDKVYIYALNVSDSEGDAVTIDFEGLPDWLTFIPESNLLSGVAGNEMVGTYNFSVKASDGNKESAQNVLITVINVNDPPEISYYLERQHLYNNRENVVQLPADCIIDPDVGDELGYSLSMENNSAIPDWLSFDPVALTLAGNPPHDSRGVYNLKLVATDKGKLSEWMIFQMQVSFPTAIGDVDDNHKFYVYPNPVHDLLNFNIPDGNKNARIIVSNIAGQVVKSMSFPSGSKQSIVFNEPSGVYLIAILQGDYQQVERIIKK